MTITQNNKVYTLKYKKTKIDDEIYDMNKQLFYYASIVDADDLNWIVVDCYIDEDKMYNNLDNHK
jgi:hypothetical protein